MMSGLTDLNKREYADCDDLPGTRNRKSRLSEVCKERSIMKLDHSYIKSECSAHVQ